MEEKDKKHTKYLSFDIKTHRLLALGARTPDDGNGTTIMFFERKWQKIWAKDIGKKVKVEKD